MFRQGHCILQKALYDYYYYYYYYCQNHHRYLSKQYFIMEPRHYLVICWLWCWFYQVCRCLHLRSSILSLTEPTQAGEQFSVMLQERWDALIYLWIFFVYWRNWRNSKFLIGHYRISLSQCQFCATKATKHTHTHTHTVLAKIYYCYCIQRVLV